MSNRRLALPVLCFMLLCAVSCNNSSLVGDKGELSADLELKKLQLPYGNLFEYEKLPMKGDEHLLMDFLYAYMAEADITDYSPLFYLKNVQLSLQAREEMAWGVQVPDKVFRHFVLPVRVNNEALDSSRMVFYAELKERVKNMTMEQAALEINHWCHEKVTYRPSDSRTSSPLASVRTALGRCGEESTFAVAALRALCIPARQVYTPRWAHTDDNHAWVEVWVDGRWHFLGACEPEPVLDLGWFNAPASRGMLMHTRVFGRYSDVEEVMSQTANYTEINVIENYAKTALGRVQVVDEEGAAVVGARVEFKLYNYAEYYTVALKTSDESGMATLTAGLGDMLVFASKGDRFGLAKYSFGKDSVTQIKLEHTQGDAMTLSLDVTPPAEQPNIPPVSPEMREQNTLRSLYEDSVRKAYEATFMNEQQAVAFAVSCGYDAAKLSPLLVASRGNHGLLCGFLQTLPDTLKKRAILLLEAVSQKDLRDITLQNLQDHLYGSVQGMWSDEDFARYILNPRIAGEELTPYKGFLQKTIAPVWAGKFRENPLSLLQWCKDSVKIDATLNTVNIYISPKGVFLSRVADERSLKNLFVAMARSLGIPSWCDGVTGKIFYKQNDGKTREADFSTALAVESPKGELAATFTATTACDNPQYYRHYSLSKYGSGTFALLNYDENESSSWNSMLRMGTTLDAGYYVMVTGTRMASGSVLSQLTFFNVEPDAKTLLPLVMRESSDAPMVIGSFDSESLYLPQDAREQQSILKTTGRGYFVVGLLGLGGEPTDHALRDIALKAAELEAWGRPLLLLFADEAQLSRFNPSDYKGLPKNILFGVDVDGKIKRAVMGEFKLNGEARLPLLWVGDTFNRVLFFSQGYSIGLGEQLMNTIRGL